MVGHLAGQMDAEGGFVSERDTVVHVPGERATKTTSTVSVPSKERGRCVMPFTFLFYYFLIEA